MRWNGARLHILSTMVAPIRFIMVPMRSLYQGMLKWTLILSFLASACFAQKESLLIGPGDLLHVQVFDTPEMDQHVRVTDAGTVPLMFIGAIHVAGLTPTDASQTIEK